LAGANANPLSQAGKISGKITRRKIVDLLAPKAQRRVFIFRIPIAQHRLDRPHDEGQANEDQSESRLRRSRFSSIAHVPNMVGAERVPIKWNHLID
jgi:hypothetical protein